jgi:hypothetical protein
MKRGGILECRIPTIPGTHFSAFSIDPSIRFSFQWIQCSTNQASEPLIKELLVVANEQELI